MDVRTGIRRSSVALIWLALFLGASRGFAKGDATSKEDEDRRLRVQALRADAAAKLASGRWAEARAAFDQLLALAPDDAAAKRDAGRAGMAAGELAYAARVLEQAHHGAGHNHDPELHYLRGEALYALERTDEARAEHRIAELEIGGAPLERMPALWLARIYARRGELERADRVYETLWPAEGQPADAEVALNHADAHLLLKDWHGAELVLRRFLGRDPDNLRGRHMLAWALEAQGDLDAELAVRARLAVDDPTAASQLDYGRALERAGDYRDAYRSYDAAANHGGTPDATLVMARDRMRYRLTPEAEGGLVFRTDPTTTGGQLRAGAALPFASRQLVSFIVTHDVARGGWPVAETSASAVNAQVLLVGPWAGSLLLSGQARGVTEVPVAVDGTRLQSTQGLRFGGMGELRTPPRLPVRLEARGEVENQWNEAPIAIRESGAVTGVTGHIFVFPVPKSERVIIDLGTQARRLMLAPAAAVPGRPEASQLLAWAGADLVVWQNPIRALHGQILDENLVRPIEVAESVVFSFRHYELYGRNDPEFERRIALLSRSRIDMGSLLARGALWGGRAGFELRGGLGFESTRRDILAQGGASVFTMVSRSSRVSLSYDIAQELISGLIGRRHTGWVSYHADL